jgi:ClpP class serine protease
MTQAELVLAIDVIQHASLWLNSAVDRLEAIDALCDLTDAAADLAEAVSLNTDTKDYITTCLADQPDVAIIVANTVLDGD